MATLVCHHMQDATLIDFLKKACSIAKRKVILNDLHRHPLALWGFQALAPLFFRNRLIQHDGPLSVRRAFTREDWKRYLTAAGISPDRYTIRWQWAFRWIVESRSTRSTPHERMRSHRRRCRRSQRCHTPGGTRPPSVAYRRRPLSRPPLMRRIFFPRVPSPCSNAGASHWIQRL